MTTFIVLILIVAFFIWAVRMGNKNKKVAEEQEAYWQQHPEERKFESGAYLGGHPDVNNSIPKTRMQISNDSLSIYSVDTRGKIGTAAIATIPAQEINTISVEDKSTVEKKLTAGRVLALGVFALAAKKKKVVPEYYLLLNWGSGKITNDTMFRFDGNNAQQSASALRSAIASKVNSL